MEDFDLDGEPKDQSHRTLALGTNKIHFKKSDPYGFWTVNWDRGAMPDALQGQFTTYEHAEKAVRAYLQAKRMEVPELEVKAPQLFPEDPQPVPEPKPERPVLKLKPLKKTA